MIIRRFKKEDSQEVCKMVSRVFNEFVASEFTKRAVQKWLKEQVPEEQIKRAKTGDVYVAISDNKIIGMIEGKENNRITRLFVDKKYHRRGIARKLVNKIEKLYKKRGAKKMLIRSSSYATKFYEKMGYKKTRGLVKKDGMIYQPMKKILK
jgi:GNAT superfamily N-acetyltransferase